MSNSTGVTLNVPAINNCSQPGSQTDQSYSFTTAMYSSTDHGAFKVAHSVVGLPDDASDWWLRQYGRAPDPAINLPWVFQQMAPNTAHCGQDWWQLRPDDPYDTRHWMRGFFLRNNYPNVETGKYDLISGNPADGDIVRLCARVHNFSLGRDTGDFDADFYFLSDFFSHKMIFKG